MTPLHLLALSALSASVPAPDASHALDEIVVTATKSDEAAGDVAATVSAIDETDIDRHLVHDLRDLLRYEPGVSVGGDLTRFGVSGISIRGLDGNRVAIEIDAVPIADAFAIGSFSNAGRAAVDVDLLKRVEIVRGPGSSLYGSDALAGVVSFVTKDPDDLTGTDHPFGARLKLGVHGVDDAESASGLVAVGNQRWSMLALGSARQGHERENFGDDDGTGASRTAPNPQDYDDRSLLAKILFQPTAGHRLKLTADLLRRDTQTDVMSARTSTASGPSTVRTDRLLGDDAQDRDRVSLDWRIEAANTLFDVAHLLAWHQSTETTQDTFEARTTLAASGAQSRAERERRFFFGQSAAGVEATMQRDFALGATRHRLVYGGEWQRTDTEQLRDGLQRNLVTGVESPVIGPDTFPVRDFPISRTRESALYLQDRVRFAAGAFELVPGLRWDSIGLDPRPDPIFAADNPGVTPASAEHDELSAKLGASWKFAPDWSLHAQWAEGFRAPPYSDVNVGFTNLQFGYTALPNPDLNPETSRGTELGVRVRGEAGFAALTVFRNDYRDFIESFVSLGVDPATGLLVFQSQNIADVRIEGAELRAGLDLDAWSQALRGWRANAALSYARGNDETRGEPLSSVDPARAVFGVGYGSQDGVWDAELSATAVQRKRRLANATPAVFAPPGHVLFDFVAQWHPLAAITVGAGVFNLLDKRAWNWADVRGRNASDPALDRYTSPGRHLGAQLIVEF